MGRGFVLLAIGAEAPERLEADGLTVPCLQLDPTEALAARYLGGVPAAIYLIRPDQHVAARWDSYEEQAVAAALARAMGKE